MMAKQNDQEVKGAPGCQSFSAHEDVVETVRNNIPPDDLLNNLGGFFKILGDPTRIKILQALIISELCVCDISLITGASQSTVSHHLKTLRQTNLVKYRKEGKTVFYSLSDDHVTQILSVGLTHIQE